MKAKRYICLALAIVTALACFAGCRKQNDGKAPTEPKPQSAIDAEQEKLENSLIEYLKEKGHGDENFVVSPLSYKAALTLVALGAQGETQRQLLGALGFKSEAEMIAWYEKVLASNADFEDHLSPNNAQKKAYKIANSIWANTSKDGRFVPDYIESAKKRFLADAKEEAADRITAAVNDWVDAATDGMISHLVDDISNAAAVLVNALYLKTAWTEPFSEYGEDKFTTKSGETVDKNYIIKTDRSDYYKDDSSELVVIPLEGNLSFVVVVGDDTDIIKKVNNAESKMVSIKMPVFDIESTFSGTDLCGYLKSVGCTKMFTGDAEFSKMFTTNILIGDIVQKSKVHIDKDGLEAAAATAVVALETAAQTEPEPVIEFVANRAYSFYIIDGSDNPEILFYGQIVK